MALAHSLNSSLELGVPIAVIHYTKRRAGLGKGRAAAAGERAAAPHGHARAARRLRLRPRPPPAARSEPLAGFIVLAFALVIWMKLISFAHANWRAEGAKSRTTVPGNPRAEPGG